RREDSGLPAIPRRAGTEDYVSFYSGHTGFAFSSALSGAYLFSLRSPDPWARRVMWASELGLAGATATLRIVAGRHYPSDVLVGLVAGAAFGVGVPWLHGYRELPGGFGSDVVWGLAGLGAGVALSSGAALFGAFD